MIIQTNDQNGFNQKAWRIRIQVSKILIRWGLLPRFKRWRLTRDPETGMVVLFGVLNNKYIATHTTLPFSDYFDPRLLSDLTRELGVQVVSCNSDGLRYAFILARGSLKHLPTHVDYPFIDNGKLLVRVVYDNLPPPTPAEASSEDEHALVEKGVGAFLKVFDDSKLRVEVAVEHAAQTPPAIVVIDFDEFQKRVAEHEAGLERSRHIKALFGSTVK